MQAWRTRLADEIEALEFEQYMFFRQWRRLHNYARERGIHIMGDLPIYVAHDSADVWAHPDLFQLDAAGDAAVMSGVPPDYFSATGQLWGNPIYRWDRMAETGFRWWIDRVRAALAQLDLVRLDHFRGLEAYWEVPAGETTARNGRWVKGPGAALFEALQAAIGELPIVAENLGVITPEVEAIRTQFGFPGMAILQFAFRQRSAGARLQAAQLPARPRSVHGHARQRYNRGWWSSAGRRRQHAHRGGYPRRARLHAAYLATDGTRDPLGVHPRPDGVGGQYRSIPVTGRAGAGQRGSHEYSRRAQRQLAMALLQGDGDSGNCAAAERDGVHL